MRVALAWAVWLSCLLCVGCAMLTPAKTEAVMVLHELLRAGTITQGQFESLLAALREDQFGVWVDRAITAVTGAGMAYGAVQLRRGPVTARRKGLPVSTVG